MTFQLTFSFIFFVALSGITPGPANLTSLGTSLQYGKAPALRQWFGLWSGCATDAAVSCVIVYFLGTALNDYVKWLAFVGAAYLVYLSVHMLGMKVSAEEPAAGQAISKQADGLQSKDSFAKQPGFWRGYFLQLTNVKVILTCITALSSYVLPNTKNVLVLAAFGVMCGCIQPFCNLAWLFTGLSLQKFFAKYQKGVNIAMAVALLLCAASLVLVPFSH